MLNVPVVKRTTSDGQKHQQRNSSVAMHVKV
jgi:hypothetical protein